MRVLESHAFRLPVRRFVLDLFGKNVMRRIVLEDDDDDCEDDGGDEESQGG